MKMLLLVLSLLTCVQSFAVNNDSSPYSPELANLLRQIDPIQDSSDGNHVLKVARVTYDAATQGGASGSTYNTGVYLPKGSVLVKSWYHIITQFIDSGTGTVAIQCEDADNILTAADITSKTVGLIYDANQTGGVSAMGTGIADDCQIKVAFAGAPASAGKLRLFVQYLVHE